jgi:hypothetical protein
MDSVALAGNAPLNAPLVVDLNVDVDVEQPRRLLVAFLSVATIGVWTFTAVVSAQAVAL